MKKEATTHNWNYTLPNLLDYLEFLSSQVAKNQSDLEIISQLNSSLFVFGNFSESSSDPLMVRRSTTPPPVNKPYFTFNFSFGSVTMSPFIHGYPLQLNASGFQLLSGYDSSSYESMPPDGLDGPSSTNLLMNINDSFVSIDDAWWLTANESTNYTGIPSNHTNHEAISELVSMIVTSTILGVMILTTVIGNVFVIAAILLERNLQQVANFLIVSLAVADLMVACLVMPLGAVYEISNEWALGPELCDMWTSSDVLCCTASILHLVAIALDRYWAVTHVDYIHSRNGKRIGIMIFFVWMTALAVSIAPLFGWKDADFSYRVNEQKRCLVSQDISYQIFATMATFYVPLTAILILYWKIFQTARKRIHKRSGTSEIKQHMLKKVKTTKKKSKSMKPSKTNGIPLEETTAFTTEASGHMGILPNNPGGGIPPEELLITTDNLGGSPDNLLISADNLVVSPDDLLIPSERSSNNGAALSVSGRISEISPVEMFPKEAPPPKEIHKKTKKETLEAKREKKAAKTLAIITGAFVVCWLPFFVNALVMSICPECPMSDLIFSIFLWLGYFNSTLNPIIYTIFSPEFRQAFKRILCGRKNQRYRPGKMN